MAFTYDIALDHKIRKLEYKFKITIMACLNLILDKIQTYNILCIKSKWPLGRDRKKCIKISGQDYNIITSTLVRNYNIIIHKILCSRQKFLYSKFKFTIFCALSLNHLWAEIEKIHKISGHNYDIAISTLVRNYNIIIYKISELKKMKFYMPLY